MSVKLQLPKLPPDVKITPELLTKLRPDVIDKIIELHRLCLQSKIKDPQNKIKNPASNVCVKIDGKIGQEIIRLLSSSSLPSGPSGPSGPPKVPSQGIIMTPTTGTKWFLDRPIEEYSWNETGLYQSGSKTYILPHNREFPRWIVQEFKQFLMLSDLPQSCVSKEGSKTKPTPFQHQQFIMEYMAPDKPYRGILLDHDLGSGKTRTAIGVAEQYRKQGVNVVVLLPATLRPNWIDELKKWGNDDISRPADYDQRTSSEKARIDAQLDQVIAKSYTFVSYNASNTLQQINRAKNIGDRFVHRLIIVDEVHNFVSMMVNPHGKKGFDMYQSMMDVTDCKFLFLSATPLLNTPFELGLLFNILKGYMVYGKNRVSLFPEKGDDFENLFVDSVNGRLKEPLKFTRRILGMVSYYFGGEGEVFPKVIKQDNPTLCPFTPQQFKKYRSVRAAEMDKETIRKRRLAQTRKKVEEHEDINSTFRIFSRQLCNYAFPEDLMRPYPDLIPTDPNFLSLAPSPQLWTPEQREQLISLFETDEELENFENMFKKAKTPGERLQLVKELVGGRQIQSEYTNVTNAEDLFILQEPKMPASYAESLEEALTKLKEDPDNFMGLLPQLSPKMQAIFENIVYNGPPGPCFVYSQFRHMEGIAILAQVLESYGFEQLNPLSSILELSEHPTNRYVIYSGEETLETRDKIKKIFNHYSNQQGGLCRVILGTSASAEGISFRNVRQVHIMEPYWNEVRIQQVIGRARRICSHIDLPPEDRNIYVYRYHMVMTPEQQKQMGEPLSTDQAIYQIAQRKELINSQFLQLLKNASVDCVLNLAHNRTLNNPIECFSFAQGETGLTFEPDIRQEKMDVAYTAEREKTIIRYARVTQPFTLCGDMGILYNKIQLNPLTNQDEYLYEKVKFGGSKPIIYTGLVYYRQISPLEPYQPICVRITTTDVAGQTVNKFIFGNKHPFEIIGEGHAP